MRFSLLLLLLALPLQAYGTTTTQPAGSVASKPNIILITLDTTRADRMGFMGSKKGLTPNLDQLAHQSVVFTRAYAQVPLTTPSHANIFTGTYPQFNHLDYMGQPLGADLPYLPDILRHRGYKTAAFVGSLIIDPQNPVAAGFGRGFETYDAPFHNRAKGEDRYQSVERRANAVVESVLAWLKTHPQGPYFIWVHCYDAHAPYDPPEPYKTKYPGEPYDGEIAYTDAAMGKLLSGLKARNLYDNTLIALMADHGEALGEHGEHHHGIFLYDETVHVPLLVKMPKQSMADKRVDERVRLVDVAPTILEAIGSPVPKAMQGESALPLMKAVGGGPSIPSADRAAYSETDYAHRAFGWSALRSWRTGKYLYVDAPEQELYDQTVDPGALHNLAPQSKAVAVTMQAQADQFRKSTASSETVRAGLTPEQSESLRALGYVGTDASAASDSQDRGADPKGKTAIAYLLDEGLEAIQEQDFEAAVPKLEEVLKLEPNTPLAYLELGRAYLNLKNYDRALPNLRTAVEKLPNDANAHLILGQALIDTHQWDEAAPELERSVKQNPTSAELRFSLAVVYERSQKFPEAIESFRETIKLKPDHFKANLLLGRLLGMQGRGAEAIPYLRTAAKLDPKSIEAHMYLANVYAQVGDQRKVEFEKNEVARLKAAGAGQQP